MTFAEVVAETALNEPLVREFNRLFGRSFGKSMKRSPMEVAVDKATGYSGEDEDDLRAFIGFCWRCVWLPLQAQAAEEP